MAATGLLALLDDMSAILDDVATMSKVAAKKTAGIAGDDLAVNAQGLVGLDPSRELPIVGKVALGSGLNKLVLIPLALALPQSVITPLLMIGGAFLCYEGLHKIFHKKSAGDEDHRAKLLAALQEGPDALAAMESKKVKQAIVTDIILSAEIVAVALGAVAQEPFATKATVLAVVGFGMTIAIYGLVAGIVKLDDIGLHLQGTSETGGLRRWLGTLLVEKTPVLMKGISVVGTAAMFMVGGGIVLHGTPGAEEWIHHQLEGLGGMTLLRSALGTLAGLAAGVVVGAVAMLLVAGAKRLLGLVRPSAPAAH